MDSLLTSVTLLMVVLVRFSNTMLEDLSLATMIGWKITGDEPRSGDSVLPFQSKYHPFSLAFSLFHESQKIFVIGAGAMPAQMTLIGE